MTLTYILVGVGAGVMSGLFGIGGGVVIVPALLLFARMHPHLATGTSLSVFLLPVGILGAIQYYRSGNIDVHATLWIALGLLAGAFFGARLALALDGVLLKRLFAVFLMLVAIRVWTSP
jgi:uncharacterized membrane protein YfcA